jgi:hypothetical protein
MGFLGHFYLSWGTIVQILAFVHFFMRRPSWYWFYVILMGGWIGAVIYGVVEIVPDFDLAQAGIQRFARGSRIASVEATVRANPSVANLEELGELYWDQRKYPKAREVFDRAIATKGDSARTFYRRAQCEMEMRDFAAAVPDLEQAMRSEPKIDNFRGVMLLGQAYAATGKIDAATAWMADSVTRSSTPEVLYSYAAFLASQNRNDEAREWLDNLEEKRKTSPRYVQRVERSWFRKGKALSNQLKKTAVTKL